MAVDMFLKVENVTGESTDAKHAGEIEVLSWSWGMTQQGTSHVGSGAGAGKVDVQNLTITKYVDKSSPTLIKKCCKGDEWKTATLYIRKAGESPLEYVKLEMFNGIVTSVAVAGSAGDDRFTENVSLNFSSFKYTYTPQKGGKGEGPIPATWNIAKNADSPVP